MDLNPIEKDTLNDFRRKSTHKWKTPPADEPSEWLRFGLILLNRAGSIVRKMRLGPLKKTLRFKADGSPVTLQEEKIEKVLQLETSRFRPDMHIVGEESGGRIPDQGLAVAIDPVDGTWALLNRMETCATSLVFLRDLEPFLGMVLNPVTGELAYAFSDGRSRLLQLSMFGEDDVGYDLPLEKVHPESVLVNVHPSKNAGVFSDQLFRLWHDGELDMLRMPGGSPAFFMLEAAKGSFNYVNLWSRRPAAVYDLLAGVMIVRGAGGDVIGLSEEPINGIDHAGPFIAGIDRDVRSKFMRIINQVIGDA